MRRALLLLVVACGSSAKLPTGAIAATVTHYDYTLDLDSRAAHATVTATVTTAGDCWTIPFRASAPANPALDGVGTKSATADGTNLTVCGKGYEAGATLVLDLDDTIALATEGPSQIGYSIRMDPQQNPFYYLVSWVNGCDQFAPCDSSPDQFATYHFDITHAANITARCPGGIVEDSPTETECSFDFEGGPTYSTFGIAAYPAWTQTDLGMWNDVHVVLYDNPATGIAARVDGAWHSGYIAWLESELGPYPFGGELRLLTAPTYWNGFEHPGNIVLNDTLAMQTQAQSGYADTVQHVIDHEMTHMWAGDQTTLSGTYDFVWKESMAEYLSYVWEDMQDPTTGATTAAAWKKFGVGDAYYPVPDDHPALFTYYSSVYGPGPMILFRQLEVLTSRAAVLAGIQSVLGHQHAISVDDLVTSLQTSTGMDLTAYKTGWIEGSGTPAWPRVDLTFTPDTGTGTSTLAIHLANPGANARPCKFHVALDGATADEQALVAIDATAGFEQTITTVPTPAFAVTALELDPQSECLVYLDSATLDAAPPIEPWVAPPAISR